MPKPPQQYFHMVLFLFFSIYIIKFKILIHLNWTARSVFSASGPRSASMRMPACSLHSLRDSEKCGVSFVLRCFCDKVSFSQSLPSPPLPFLLFFLQYDRCLSCFLFCSGPWLGCAPMGALFNLEAGCQYWKPPDTSSIQPPLRWLDWIFWGGYLPSLSINYVAMRKDMEKSLPQLYYIKMKISYDLGFIAIGVAMAT